MTSLIIAAAIGISPVDPHYFADESGKTWIPVGCNICFDRYKNDSAAARKLYDGWMTAFAENGGNYARLWLSCPFLDVMPDKAYEFSEEATDNLKWLVSRAEALGIKLKFTFENFRRIGGRTDEDPASGVVSFCNPVYVPYAKTMTDFFESDKCADIYLAKVRHIAEAVGRSDALMAVELWNEITATGGGLAAIDPWTKKMLPELKKIFPGKMAVQNLGSFSEPNGGFIYDWLASLKDSDFLQAHRYYDPGAPMDVCRAEIDVLCADAIRELRDRRADVPVILAEVGAVEQRHSTYSHRYEQDKTGMLIHDAIFAPFFAGSAGCGQPWHWDNRYISKHNLWWHFGRFKKAIDGLDPVAERFKPFRTETQRFRMYGLKGVKTTVIWFRDKRVTHELLDRGMKPEPVVGAKLMPWSEYPALFFPGVSKFSWYLPWQDKSVESESIDIPEFTHSAVLRFATAEWRVR